MPQALTVSITARDLSRVLIFPDLRFEVQRYGFQIEGGPKQATIRVYGPELALRSLRSGIRGAVDIWDELNNRAWWGCLWSMTIHTGTLVYGWTLDEMANSVNISYLKQSVNQQYSGSGTQVDTGFLADAASVAEYGTFEKTLRGGNGSAAAATGRQALELANRKLPQQIFGVSTATDEGYADLVCRGWIETLDHRYYTNNTGAAAGIESNEVLTAEAMQFLGRAHPAMTTIGFGTSGDLVHLICTSGELAISELEPYNYVFTTGSATAQNNDGRLVTATRSPGSDYTLGGANFVLEAPGASIVIHDAGAWIYQTFTLATNNPFDAVAVDIRIMQLGAPTDQVFVKLYSDLAGTPDTLLAIATIDFSEIGTSMGWVTGVFATPHALTYGTTYGLLVTRTGTQNFSCYGVGVDTALSYAGGVMTIWAGANMGLMPRPVAADLIFKLSGSVEITTQIGSIISAEGEFVASVQVDNTTGIKTLPYQDGTLTALATIQSLAAFGTSNNRRLLYQVTPQRVLRLYEEPVYGTSADILVDSDGVARFPNQQPIPAQICPYGQWVEFAPLVFYANDDKYFFCDEAEYDALKGAWRVIRLRNRASDLDLTRIVQ